MMSLLPTPPDIEPTSSFPDLEPPSPPSPPPPPPDLAAWRDRLFHVAAPITLSAAEWSLYWPYVDNIWSHRSTQTSKSSFAKTHYYDCRLKGRPPGIAPSVTNPNRKKRKRVARERDLCDVKIKVTETMVEGIGGIADKVYIIERLRREVLHRATPGGGYVVEKLDREQLMAQMAAAAEQRRPGPVHLHQQHQEEEQQRQQQLEDGVNSLTMFSASPESEASSATPVEGRMTVVVGSGIVELDSYGIPGLLGEVHRHTLEYSDGIKKSSVEREALKRTKELKKHQGESRGSSA